VNPQEWREKYITEKIKQMHAEELAKTPQHPDYIKENWARPRRLNLSGQAVDTEPKLKEGLISVYENLDIMSDLDIVKARQYRLSLESRQGDRGVGRRMGAFKGLYRGLIPDVPGYPFVIYSWTTKDPRVEARKRVKAHLKSRPGLKLDLERGLIQKLGGRRKKSREELLAAAKARDARRK
jgi:hypothetical protein